MSFSNESGFAELLAAWPIKKPNDNDRALYDSLVNGSEAEQCHEALLAAAKADGHGFGGKWPLSSYLQRRHGATMPKAPVGPTTLGTGSKNRTSETGANGATTGTTRPADPNRA